MSSKKIRIQILNPKSGCGHTSLAHAKRYVRRGVAEWVGGDIRFLELDTGPRLDVRDAPDFRPADSGFSGFLRYPMPHGGGCGRFADRYPVLARMGAGLL